MIKAFIDLAENVTLMVTKNRSIAYYTDMDYSDDLLDKLFAILNNLNIDEANVMLHGIVSERLTDGDLSFAGAQVKESYSDYKAIEHLFKALGTPRVFFYDFIGYWSMGLKPKTLVVYQDDSTYNFVVFDGLIKHTSVVMDANLKQQVLVLCNKFELTSVIDADSLCHESLVSYFSNADEVKPECRVHLARFAYMMTKDSEKCRVSSNRFKKPESESAVNNSTVESAKETQIASNADTNESSEATPKTKSLLGFRKVKKVSAEKSKKDPVASKHSEEIQRDSAGSDHSRDRKSKRFGLPTPLCIILVIVLLGVIVGCSLAYKFLEQKQKKDLDNYNQISQQYELQKAQLAGYNRVLKSDDTNSIACVSIIDSIDFSKCASYTCDLEGRVLQVNANVANRSSANQFIRTIKKKYKVSRSSVKKARKYTAATVVIEVA